MRWPKPSYFWIAALAQASISREAGGAPKDGEEFFEDRIRPFIANPIACTGGGIRK